MSRHHAYRGCSPIAPIAPPPPAAAAISDDGPVSVKIGGHCRRLILPPGISFIAIIILWCVLFLLHCVVVVVVVVFATHCRDSFTSRHTPSTIL